jgi:hypothetical protein
MFTIPWQVTVVYLTIGTLIVSATRLCEDGDWDLAFDVFMMLLWPLFVGAYFFWGSDETF